MTSSRESRPHRPAGRAPSFAVALIVVLASLLAWAAWNNAVLREQRSALQQQNDALRQSLRDAVPAAAPAPAGARASLPPAVTAPQAAAPARPADPLAPLAAPARIASGPSLERALEAMRERASAPRTSPFGSSATGS